LAQGASGERESQTDESGEDDEQDKVEDEDHFSDCLEAMEAVRLP